MSLLTLHNVSLTLAGQRILDQVNWQIKSQSRIAIVGRNGAGKSTLLQLLQGNIVQDHGKLQRRNGLSVAGLTQEIPISHDETVYHFLVKQLGPSGEILASYRAALIADDQRNLAECQQSMDDLHLWTWLPKIETMASKLGVQVDADMCQLSGGMKRRALLAASLIVEPDLLLLDEPTNHLDISAIEWLESYLKTFSGSVLLVTHDRDFLSNVANQIVEIDRGNLIRFDCDYETYLDRREALRECEDKHNALFDKRLDDEETWLRTGVKARRTRNEGRVRALKAMREASQKRRAQVGKVKAVNMDTLRSGQDVIDAQGLNYSLNNRCIVRDFTSLFTRGDKVGIIGPNGCGKTTLIRLLLGELVADSGQVKRGTSLEIAYFDQLRTQLDEHKTVMDNVADGADHVTIQGKSKHVASYLRDFLFPPERFNQLVSTLSGGERNRLLLAKLFANPVNLLVMDEPTNDLDIETLELLESMLINFSGTLLLISHDRAFINNVVTSILIYEEDGKFHDYVGGYDDYQALKKPQRDRVESTGSTSKRKNSRNQLSFQEQRELSHLPEKIESSEKKIEEMHLNMAKPEFYSQELAYLNQFQNKLIEEQAILQQLYARWELLEEKLNDSAATRSEQ